MSARSDLSTSPPFMVDEEELAFLKEITTHQRAVTELARKLLVHIAQSAALSPQRKAYWYATIGRVVQPETTHLHHLLERLANELATGRPPAPNL